MVFLEIRFILSFSNDDTHLGNAWRECVTRVTLNPCNITIQSEQLTSLVIILGIEILPMSKSR